MDWSRSKRSSFSVGSFKPLNLSDQERYQNFPAPFQTNSNPLQSTLPIRSAYYETHLPLFYSDWHSSRRGGNGTELIALSTYREDSINKIEIINGSTSLVEHANGLTSEGLDFVKISEATVEVPITKLQWDPTESEKFLTTSDRLKLWEFGPDNKLIERANLINSSQHSSNNHRPQSLPPLCSFDWNKVNPNIVITCSIDTTCTVWDLNQPSSPKTQLIAHDSEVFDVQFIKGSADIFASVGCDGSMRVFDLRSLDHSTIIYEPSSSTTNTSSSASTSNSTNSTTRGDAPLLRLAASNTDPNIVATFAAKSDAIYLMDMRFPGHPTSVLTGHSANINSIKWHPTQSKLLSGADDCQALIWDLNKNSVSSTSGNNNNGRIEEFPSYAYSDTFEINNVTWNPSGDWIGVVSGKGFQGVKVAF